MRLLISNNRLRENSTIDKNISDQDVKVSVKRAQDMELEPLLGTTLFEKLLSIPVDGTGELKYQNLIQQYCWNVLISGTQFYLYRLLWIRATNRGVIVADAQGAASAEISELNSIMNEFREDMKKYEDKLTKHLIDQSSLYPELTQNTDLEDIPPAESLNIGGFYYDMGPIK